MSIESGQEHAYDRDTRQIDPSIWEDEARFKELCETAHPAEVAEGLGEVDSERVAELLRVLEPTKRAEVFSNLNADKQADLVELLNKNELAVVLQKMPPDERADVFNFLSDEMREDVLPLLARAEREDILRLGSYEEGTAGAVMTSDYATLDPKLTIREAIDRLRLEAPRRETIYNAYVIDSQRRLIGVVSLRDLILASPSKRVEEIMKTDVIFARVTDSQEEVAKKFSKYDLLALPIVNGGDALVGIVTVDDVLDVTEEEATTDFQLMGSSAPIGVSVKEAGLFLLFKKRIPWLLVLVFMNVLSGAGIALFQDVIGQVVTLVLFLPLILGSGGNAGSQSATLMVRALATGDVRLRDWFELLGREILVAFALGFVMAIAVSSFGFFRAGREVTMVVAIAMIAVVMFGSLMGMLLPFIFTRFKMDPATASAPLITSLTDVAGVIIYFSIAKWYLFYWNA